ncbi:MAG: AAA family ATPase [Victivallales bacterium]|nr:AAA family ATPase [Victivallales bacterium]
MELKTVKINRLPGIFDRFSLKNLQKGINIIYGPNGSGKTSICNLVKTSLWEKKAKNLSDTDAVLEWADSETKYNTDIFNSVKWNSSDSGGAPSVPAENLAECFHISISEMFDSSHNTEVEIAKKIYTEMSGGCDFNILKEKNKIPPRALKKEIAEYEQLIKEKRKLENIQDGLAEKQDKIAILKKEQMEAVKAGKKLSELEQIDAYLELQNSLNRTENKLDAFPEIMDRLTGDELDTLKKLKKEIFSTNEKIRKTEKEIGKAEKELSELELPPDCPSKDDLALAQKIISRLRTQSFTLDSTIKDFSASEKKLNSITGVLEQYGIFSEDDEFFSPDTLKEFLNFKKKSSDLSYEINVAEQQKKNTEIELKKLESENLSDFINEDTRYILKFLQKRLRIPELNRNIYVYLQSAFSGLLFVSGFSTFFLSWDLFLPLIFAGAFFGTFIYQFLARLQNRKLMKSIESELKNYYDNEIIDKENALKKIEELLADRAFYEANQKRIAALNALKENFEEVIKDKSEELRGLLNKIKQNGLFNKIKDYVLEPELQDILNIIDNFRNEYFKKIEQEEKKQFLEKSCLRLSDKIFSLLKMDRDEMTEAEKFEVLFNRINNNIQAKERLLGVIRTKQQYLADYREKLHSSNLQKLKLMEKLEMEDLENAEITISGYLERLSHFRELKKEKIKFQNQLQGKADIKEILDNYDINKMDELKIELRNKSDNLEQIIEEIKEIQSEIKYAEKERKLFDCDNKIAFSKYKLDNTIDEILKKLISEFIIEEVEKRYELNNQPKIMQDAVGLFAKFTNNRYFLKIKNASAKPFFTVIDNDRNSALHLNQLSDGTKIQLFLAVRIAFIKSVETRYTTLPIFFDEALSVTDSRRFSEIASTLFKISRENNRQIFYLTSDYNDVLKFQKACSDSDRNLLNVINLGKLRQLAMKNENYKLPEPEEEGVPHPANCGYDVEKYSKLLKIPEFNPYKTVTSNHLFHILRDKPKILFKILSELKVYTVGQLLYLLENNETACNKLLTSKIVELLKLRHFIMKNYQREWLKGRTKPVFPGIFNSLLGNSKFLSPIRDILAEINYDTDKFLYIINNNTDKRLKGFMQVKKTEIVDFLKNEGYVPSEKILEKHVIHSNIMKLFDNTDKYSNYTAEKLISEVNFIAVTFKNFY